MPYHSCNPSATVALVSPYSKNKRVVTVIDTDVPGGTGAGLVAMIEVVALMIGKVVQQYSEQWYDDPRPVARGMFLRKGCPKSLYRPGAGAGISFSLSRTASASTRTSFATWATRPPQAASPTPLKGPWWKPT